MGTHALVTARRATPKAVAAGHGHKVARTFFPNYRHKTWCRTDARCRLRDNPDELLEMRGEVGAAAWLLPSPWFSEDAKAVSTGSGLLELAPNYAPSRGAAPRRFAETHAGSVATAFLS